MHTKYKGRVGIFEILEMDDAVRQLVLSGAGETEFREEMVKNGFLGMNKEGEKLVSDGVTSLKEYLRTMYDAK